MNKSSIILSLAILVGAATLARPAWSDDCAAKGADREQLSVGYSLLHQEAHGLPKLGWLLKFKDKGTEMGQMTSDLVHYYEDLDANLEKLAKAFPAVCLEATTMPPIVGDTRKAIGSDQAKDMAPLVGKQGRPFERETLLMFADALNEQRHLVGVMLDKETVPALKDFLRTTKSQLDSRHDKVRALLEKRYFVR